MAMSGKTKQIVMFEICHRIPGRMRLRVPILMKTPALGRRLEVALRGLDGVQEVRSNPACASLVMYHRLSRAPTPDDLARVLQPLIEPARRRPQQVSRVQPGSQPLVVTHRVPKRPAPTLAKSRLAPCRLCQLKLTAACWILADVWRCWRRSLTQRMRTLLISASGA